MSFNPTPEIGESTAWGALAPTVSYNLRIENKSSSVIEVRKVYLENRISNPQELGNIENFCLVFNDPILEYENLNQFVSGSELVENVFTFVGYDIPYLSNYGFEPGNKDFGYYSQFWPQNPNHYKFPFKFNLTSSEVFNFKLSFAPAFRKIDFYKAHLVIEYKEIGNNIIKNRLFKLDAHYNTTIKTIDGKSFTENIMSVNGINFNNIILAQ